MCSNETIPERLHRNGRQSVSYFHPEELIYRRYEKEPLFVPNSNEISAAAIRLKEDSYNRGSLCQDFKDVLYNETEPNNPYYYEGWGVAAFRYIDLEKTYTYDDPKDVREIKTSIVHSPNECMYPHCHQQVLVAGVEKEPSASIKLKMRIYMRDVCLVLKNVSQ